MSMLKVILMLGSLLVIAWADDFHLEYYSNVVMDCDDTKQNFSNTDVITRRYWMLPNGSLASVSDNNEHMKIEAANFSLTIKKIDDNDFGKYYCLLVRANSSVDLIEHGLNVDGAYFGDLLDKYLRKAMVGGIAAGSVFLVLAGGCFIWTLRYHKRNERNKAVDALDKTIDGYDLKAYDNVGIDTDTNGTANGVTEIDDKL